MDPGLVFPVITFTDTETTELFNDASTLTASEESVSSNFHQTVLPDQSLFKLEDVLQQFTIYSKSTPVEVQNQNNRQTCRCELCGKCFDNAKRYYGHLRVHSKENLWHCEKCPGTKFSTKQQLMKHESSEHTSSTLTHKCLFCPKVYSMANRLKQHIIIKHFNKRPYKCDWCPKTFAKPSDCKKHKDAVHTVTDCYMCPFCEKVFVSSAKMNRHVVTHTKVKLFTCYVCSASFTKLAALNKHTKNCSTAKAVLLEEAIVSKKSSCKLCGVTCQYKNTSTEYNASHPESLDQSEKNNDKTLDLGKSVDALVDEILFGENGSTVSNVQVPNKNDGLNVEIFDEYHSQQETDQLLKDINPLYTLDDELFSDDIDLDSLNPNQIFNANDLDVNLTDNTGVLLDLYKDYMNELYQVKSDLENDLLDTGRSASETQPTNMPNDSMNSTKLEIPKDLLDIDKNIDIIQHRVMSHETLNSLDPSLSVDDCSTIFEKDVDLEASENFTANLNQLVSENHVRIVPTEHDDTIIIKLNNIDPEQLSDMLDLDIRSSYNYINSRIEATEEDTSEFVKVKTKENNETQDQETYEIEKELSCGKCNKTFKRKDNYISHIAIHEPSLRRHRCAVCRMRFSYRSTLNKHVLAAHEPRVQRAHTCSTCQKHYKSAWQLKNHKERDHLGLTPFRCTEEDCRKKFYKRCDLIAHRRTHTGERPYKCLLCNSSFLQITHLYRHTRHRHKNQSKSK